MTLPGNVLGRLGQVGLAGVRQRVDRADLDPQRALVDQAGDVPQLGTARVAHGVNGADVAFQLWGVATLFVLNIGLPIAAFQVIFGIAATVIGAILFLVIGTPRLWRKLAPELLPGF